MHWKLYKFYDKWPTQNFSSLQLSSKHHCEMSHDVQRFEVHSIKLNS